ncbi:MAG: helix-turn-helix transcriptional regulator [Treponemataceae bacterium]|nr:helix-turn-helix transcriptional regulator [Treponemataceae bacterium]
MKVKFLLPDINKEMFAKEFANNLNIYKLKLKDLAEIGAEENSQSLVSQYKRGEKFPSINRFFTICRFFLTPPEKFFTPNLKWVECEMDDISKFRVYGIFNDVYYVIPKFKYFCQFSDIDNKVLSQEPNLYDFTKFQLPETRYDEVEQYRDGKIIYRFPSINDEKTSELIQNIIDDYKITKTQLSTLLEYNQIVSAYRLKNQTQNWTLNQLYKLSWLFSKTIEELVVFDYHEETGESLFDPILFLEHYVTEPDEI